ncbi:TPA: hypothetical protein ACSP2D_002976 [Aeromonas veronii]
MRNKLTLHPHAVRRLTERFAIDPSWLLHELECGRFVWLRGAGGCGDIKYVRAGHLLYLPQRDEFCVVIVDCRTNIAITVLTEVMSLNSTWAKSINEVTRKRAKLIALSHEDDSPGESLMSLIKIKGELTVTVQARTFSSTWSAKIVSLCKVKISASQIDLDAETCTLTDEQFDMVSTVLMNKIAERNMVNFCEIYICCKKGNVMAVSNSIKGIFSITDAESIMRWM